MFGKKSFIEQMIEKSIVINKHSKKIIVFPEIDDRTLQAASIIVKRGIAHPLILGKLDQISDLKKLGVHNLTDEHFFDYLSEKNKDNFADFLKMYVEMRHKDGKKITLEEASDKMSLPHYFGAMMVHHDLANGMITGIHGETKPYLPAFEIIKLKPGITRASGMMIMADDKSTYFFADCALNMDPTAEILAETALTSAETVINFGFKPKIAMLSFSTHDSAKHAMVDKVKAATKIAKDKDNEMILDGEIQLDAAIIPEVAKKKCPDSVLQGEANVLIFPDLNSANIGYKLVERLGKYRAIGPIMQGLNKPINDLSRGCSVEDIVDLAAITVMQGM